MYTFGSETGAYKDCVHRILPCPPEHCSVKAVGNFSSALWGLGELQALYALTSFLVLKNAVSWCIKELVIEHAAGFQDPGKPIIEWGARQHRESGRISPESSTHVRLSLTW